MTLFPAETLPADPPADRAIDSEAPVTIGRRHWTEHANCTGKTHLFFAPPGERRERRTRREATARAYCEHCTVMTICRSEARRNRETGLWGGESDEERAAAGFAPRSPHRRAIAEAGRQARRERLAEQSDVIERQAG